MNKEPIPIVASVEAVARVSACIPGINELCQSLKADCAAARRGSAVAKYETWTIARAIFEWAASDEVQAAVEKINGAEGRTGRPKLGYRLAMEEMAAQGIASMPTLERYTAEWKRAAEKLKLCPGCTPAELSHHVRENSEPIEVIVERLTMPDEVERSTSTPPTAKTPTAEEIAEAICAALKLNFYRDGKPIANAQARTMVVEKTNPVLKGIGLELVPLGKD